MKEAEEYQRLVEALQRHGGAIINALERVTRLERVAHLERAVSLAAKSKPPKWKKRDK
jgi:hypothetical protein